MKLPELNSAGSPTTEERLMHVLQERESMRRQREHATRAANTHASFSAAAGSAAVRPLAQRQQTSSTAGRSSAQGGAGRGLASRRSTMAWAFCQLTPHSSRCGGAAGLGPGPSMRERLPDLQSCDAEPESLEKCASNLSYTKKSSLLPQTHTPTTKENWITWMRQAASRRRRCLVCVRMQGARRRRKEHRKHTENRANST
jgi:hypothetical protein